MECNNNSEKERCQLCIAVLGRLLAQKSHAYTARVRGGRYSSYRIEGLIAFYGGPCLGSSDAHMVTLDPLECKNAINIKAISCRRTCALGNVLHG